jgi:hypothetical protein
LRHDDAQQETETASRRQLPRLMALERRCEYLCWCVVLPNQAALTCEMTGPPRPVLWDTLDDVLDHYGAGVAIDDNPPRHLAPSLLIPPAFEPLVPDPSRRTDGASARRGSRQPRSQRQQPQRASR